MSFEVFLAVGGLASIAALAAASFASSAIMRATAALGGASLLVAIHAFGFFRFRMDDSYITYRYARNLADGVGPVWNPGEHVEGYTSFLWMLLLAAMHVIGIDIEVAAVLLACASMIALFLLLWRVWLYLLADADAAGIPPHLVIAGAALLVAANTATARWSMSGLETPLAAALIMALVLTYQRESRAPGIPASALILVAGVMTRPEMTLIAVVTGAFFLDQAVTEGDARRWRHLVGFFVTFAVLAGTWFAWRWSYYGYLFPNTYYVKVGPPSLMIVRGWTYVSQYWWPYLLAPGLVASAALPFLLRGSPRRDAAFICGISVAWIVAIVTEGGDVFADGRFVVPVVAPLYVALLATVSLLLARIPVERTYRTAGFAAAVITAALVVTWSPNAEADLSANRRKMDEWKVTGQWIKENVPGDYLTAVAAAGVVPYFSQRRSLDLLGLTDETIAHTDVPDFGTGLAGHEKYNTDYVLEQRRPEIIWVGGASGSLLTEAKLKQSATDQPGLVPAVNSLVQDDRTWQRYEMAAFFYRDRWYPFLVRKDIEDTVNAGWIESKGLINNGPGRGN